MSKYDRIYIDEDKNVYISEDKNATPREDITLYNAVNDLLASDWKTMVKQDYGWDSLAESSSNISIKDLANKVEELEAAVEDLESRLDILLKNNSETNDSNLLEAIEKALKKYQYFND